MRTEAIVSNVSRQDEIDVTLDGRHAARDAGEERGKPGAGAGREIEAASGIFTEPEVMLTMRPNSWRSSGR